MSVLPHSSRQDPSPCAVPDPSFTPLGPEARAFRIGSLRLPGRVLLAPMAGYTDRPFRRLARRFGAALVVSEMVSARAVLEESRKTFQLMEFGDEERPFAVQLFGGEPGIMGEAAALVERKMGPDLLDVNFGCPVGKILKSGSGSALLKDPGKAGMIVRAVVQATGNRVPVTVKSRAGFDEFDGAVFEVLSACEEAGASAFVLHARTRRQMYGGRARWDVIAEAKRRARIPVVGNGDVKTPPDAGRMLRETGCDAVMVGRAAYGAPWIFALMNDYLETGKTPEAPGPRERLGVCLEHFEDALSLMGERLGVLEMRKHLTHYVKGFEGARELRQSLLVAADPAKVRKRLKDFIEASEG